METKNNLEFYEQLREVPAEAKKSFDNGRFKGTDINPMWRIKRMTELFGPCGIGWYYEVVNRSLEHSSDSNVICAFIGINLYVKVNGEWSKPIYGEGGNTMSVWNRKYSCVDTSDEAYKMALTDAFSNATKQLGLGADIWFENDKKHSTKYDLQTERKADNVDIPFDKMTPEQFKDVWFTERKITVDDIGDIAKAWRLFDKPQTVDIEVVLNAVIRKAGLVPENATDEYFVLVKASTKSDLREKLTKNNWTANKSLVEFATKIAEKLPEK